MKLMDLRLQIKAAIRNTDFAAKVYFAGGCVRDYLLERETTDFDLTVELPEGGIRLARHLHHTLGTSIPIVYQRFGTALIHYQGIKIETVMTRAESYREKNRNPEVCHSDLYADVMRRDFTVNSLLMRVEDGSILDLCGQGHQDLADQIIRTVREPLHTFGEDPLRILRAIRFALKLGFVIEPATATGLRAKVPDLRHISQERIADEFQQMLALEDVGSTMSMLQDYGVLAQILPEVSALQSIKPNKYHDQNGLEHTIKVMTFCSPDPVARWTALLHDIGKVPCEVIGKDGNLHYYGHENVSAQMAEAVLKRFNIPQKDIQRITKAISLHMKFKDSGLYAEKVSTGVLRKLTCMPAEDVELQFDLIHADNMSHAARYCMPQQIPCLKNMLSEELKKLAGIRFNLTGKDLILELGVQQGPLVGKLLNIARDIWLEDPGISHDALMRILREKLQ